MRTTVAVTMRRDGDNDVIAPPLGASCSLPRSVGSEPVPSLSAFFYTERAAPWPPPFAAGQARRAAPLKRWMDEFRHQNSSVGRHGRRHVINALGWRLLFTMVNFNVRNVVTVDNFALVAFF